MSTLVMLERADELRSMELVGRGGGELRRRWGTGLEQEREQERRGNRSMSSLWLQNASQWARGRSDNVGALPVISEAGVEDYGGGGIPWHLALRDSVERTRTSSRISGARLGA